MARNVEIKARANDLPKQTRMAAELAGGDPAILHQTDTFFHCPKGRLKLREFPDAPAQLIYYQRHNQSGPCLSEYHIVRTEDAESLKWTLRQTLGQRAVIIKKRIVFLVEQTRIHLDQVHGLGEFIELEVVMADADDLLKAQQQANRLMVALGIENQDLIEKAYVDLFLDNERALTGAVDG